MRLAAPQETLSTIRETPGYYAPSPRYPFTLARGAGFLQKSPEWIVKIETSAEGRRDRVYPAVKSPGTFRVVCLGDSFTFGQGVEMEAAWPKRLELMLAEEGRPVEVWNLGYVAGFSPDAYALFARTELAALDPDLVVVQLFPWNDFADLSENLWEDPGPDGFPGRIRSPRAYIDPQGRRLSGTDYPWRLRTPVLRESHLFQLAARVLDRPGPRDGAPRVTPDDCGGDRMRTSLAALRDACASAGARLEVLLVPTHLQLEDRPDLRRRYLEDPGRPFDPGLPERQAAAVLEELGIAWVSPLGEFRAGMGAGLWGADGIYFPVDGHWTPLGHVAAALVLRKDLRDRGWIW